MDRAFLDWLVARLRENLKDEEVTTVETVVAPAAGTVTTTGGTLPRNSNAYRRPLEQQPKVSDWLLGEDPRRSPLLMPRRLAAPPVTPLAPPQPFASLACQPELTSFFREVGAQWVFTSVLSKALPPDGGVADFPCQDQVRAKLWRRRDKRLGRPAAWGEWDYVTQEYPSDQHPYQVGVDEVGPYVAGIETRDWRHLRVSDIMPLFLSDDDKLWIPDHGHLSWLSDPQVIDSGFFLTPPVIVVDDGGGPVDRSPYATQHFPFYVLNTAVMMGSPATVQVPVKHYYRGQSVTVRQADFERREHAFDATGSGGMDESGTITLSAGDAMTLANIPAAWWRPNILIPGVVVGNHTDADEVRVSISDLAFRTFLDDHETPLRFYSGGNQTAPVLVLDVENRSGETWLILDRPVTVANNWNLQRYSIATPKSGSLTWFVRDEAGFSWEQFTCVQVYTQGNQLIYFARPATELTFSRRMRLYEGSDDTGSLLHDDQLTDAQTYGFGAFTSPGGNFGLLTDGLSSGGPVGLTSGAGGSIEIRPGEVQFGGSLPGCVFLREFVGLFPGVTARQYRFDGPVVTMNLAPIPEGESLQPSDYELLPPWRATRLPEWGAPWSTWTDLVNPLIYQGPRGYLRNPAGEAPGSSWMGLDFDERWYCADALMSDGAEVGVVLLDDEDKTLMVSVNGSIVFNDSVYSLLPCGLPGWPTASLNELYSVAPHLNFAHPSWPFPTAMVGPFAVRARIPGDPDVPVILEPLV